MDTNQDRLVTLEEFLASTQRKEFGDTGEGWKVRMWELSGLGIDLPVHPFLQHLWLLPGLFGFLFLLPVF